MKGEKFDLKKVEQLLRNENKFITNLLSTAAFPDRNVQEDEDQKQTTRPQTFNNSLKKSRAKSLQELEDRLKAITNKKKLTYTEKLAKKGLKNRMKKKNKQDERNAKLKLERAAKLNLKNEHSIEVKLETTEENVEKKKPTFNSENKIVFSKIDFANLGKKKNKRQEKDPKKLLQKLNEEKIKLDTLEQSGDIQKVVEIKEKTAWKNALAKAEGQKVRDDPILLKKSAKRKDQKVRSSKKKWDARTTGVQKAKDERQKKRSQNIEKRKKEKKIKKLKSAVKRGKIIPGF